jgi:hypothetical protein
MAGGADRLLHPRVWPNHVLLVRHYADVTSAAYSRSRCCQWFLYLKVVGVLTADPSGDALAAGSGVEDVCMFAGTIAFMGYALALVQNSIWGLRSWWTTFKALIDGLIYAVITGQTFGWTWPR